MKKLLMIAFVAVLLVSCNEHKTAYVDNSRIMEEYQEMQDVESDFTTRSEAVRTEMDSAARGFQAEVEEYQAERNTLSQSQREQREQELMQKQQRLQQQQQSIGGQLRQASDAAIDSVEANVRLYLEEYGEENGYTYIFGASDSNIMYAKEDLDITDEVIQNLNERYNQN